MKSIGFPKLFRTTVSTNVIEDMDAIKQNISLLLSSEKGELLGDPYYGVRLKYYFYDQNNYVLKDILLDEIYTALVLFMPQLSLTRNDITFITGRAELSIRIRALNKLDYTTNMYDIVLFQEGGE